MPSTPRGLVVRELWRYPVKSLGGEPLDEAAVADIGIEGDRAWGITDLGTGKVLTGRREPQLLFASARLAGGDVVITLPDGTETADDAALSAWLGRDVALHRAGEDGGVYETPTDPGTEVDWIEWQGPGRAWHDSTQARLSLVTTTTLRSTATGDIDSRRIRMNVVCDGAGEDSLVGRRVTLGTAAMRVTKPVSRCVMVTRAQPGLDRDLSVLKAINHEREGCLSIGMLVEVPGRMALGDRLEVGA